MNVDLFKADLKAAAAKAGCDLSGLLIESCTMDQTWGDRIGLFFSGQHAERAAKWFAGWLLRNRGDGSYEAQRSVGGVEAWTRLVYKANGATSHCRGEAKAPDYDRDPAAWLAGFELTPGFSVSHTYHPCAE